MQHLQRRTGHRHFSHHGPWAHGVRLFQALRFRARVTAVTARFMIGDIIGTIAGNAFQTNILALNAAVDAARQ